MAQSRQSLNLNSLLAAVEAAPPVAAADVLAGALAEAIDAREVSFLIADFSGQSLIRLGHAGGKGRLQGKETAERVPLVGTPHGRALAAQAVEVIDEDGGAPLFAPVTSRGEAVGVLELVLEDFPGSADGGGCGSSGPLRGVRRDCEPPVHRSLRVGPAFGPVVAGGGDPASAVARGLHMRGRAVHSRRLVATGG